MDRGAAGKFEENTKTLFCGHARPANSYYLRDVINPVVVVRVFLRSLFINSNNDQVVCAQLCMTESEFETTLKTRIQGHGGLRTGWQKF